MREREHLGEVREREHLGEVREREHLGEAREPPVLSLSEGGSLRVPGLKEPLGTKSEGGEPLGTKFE